MNCWNPPKACMFDMPALSYVKVIYPHNVFDLELEQAERFKGGKEID
jgi:hypothetical protein